MIIRSEQTAALQRMTKLVFEDRTVQHVGKYFPEIVKLCGEPTVRAAIREAWKRASTYHVVSERGIWQFVDVSLMLGAGFDSDPRVHWAAECLNSDRNSEEAVRMERLFGQALAFIDATKIDFPAWGGDPHMLSNGLRQLRAESPDALLPAEIPAFKSRLAGLLRTCLPARCKAVGAERINELFDVQIEASQAYGIRSQRGAAIYTSFAFLLGAGMATDPLYPWVAAALAPDVPEPERSDRLLDSGVAQVRKWLS